MDTIELTFRNRDDNLLKTLLSSIDELMTKGRRTFPGHYEDVIYTAKGGYREQHRVFIEGRWFSLVFDPRARDKSMPYIRVSFHMSHFYDYQELEAWLKKIFREHYHKLADADVNRLDFCVDLFVPFLTLKSSVYQLRKAYSSEYKSKRWSMYIGTDPEETIIYEKDVDVDRIDTPELLAPSSKNKILCTRVETRNWKDKVPLSVRKFSQLHQAVKLNPFSHILFKKIPTGRHSNVPPVVKDFELYVKRLGFHRARKEFNHQRNFEKYIGKYLVDSNIDLHKAWRNRCYRFFRVK